MLLIWGFRVLFKTVGEGTFACPTCRVDRTYRLREARRWFTFFFIPIIPLKVLGRQVQCTVCQGDYTEAVLDLPTMASLADALGSARRLLVARAVQDGGNTEPARAAAVSAMVTAGDSGYTLDVLDMDQAAATDESLLGWLAHLAPSLTPQGAEGLVVLATRIAVSDGVTTEAEVSLIRRVGTSVGLTPMHVDGILSAANASVDAS